MSEEPARQPSDRVQRRQQRARARLIKAASEVIADNGVQGLRLRDVTEIADVGFGSFYNHFESKEDLVEAVVIELMSSLASTLIASVAELADPAEAGCAAHRWFVRSATRDPQTARLIVQLDRADVLFQQMIMPYARDLIESGISSGRFNDVDVDTTLAYVVGATIAVTRGVLEGRLGPDAESASAEILLGALGLGSEEAKAIAHRSLPHIAT